MLEQIHFYFINSFNKSDIVFKKAFFSFNEGNIYIGMCLSCVGVLFNISNDLDSDSFWNISWGNATKAFIVAFLSRISFNLSLPNFEKKSLSI